MTLRTPIIPSSRLIGSPRIASPPRPLITSVRARSAGSSSRSVRLRPPATTGSRYAAWWMALPGSRTTASSSRSTYARPSADGAASASSGDDREGGVVAPFRPGAVVRADLIVTERREHQMRERGAHAGLAVGDRAGLWPEARVRVELLELVRVA